MQDILLVISPLFLYTKGVVKHNLEDQFVFKYLRSIFTILLISGICATLFANEWATYYFPDKLGSSWVYEDQDGNEITRYAIEEDEVDGETFRAFSYEPAIDDWEKYHYPVHPFLYQISEDWVAFYVGDDIEKATESILTKKLDETRALMLQQTAEQLPPGVTMDFDYTVKPTAQDYFYLLPTPVTYNEEWVAMELDVTVNMSLDIQGAPIEVPEALKNITSTTKVVETGMITGTETVETDAGTFEDCLIIEYRTETTSDTDLPQEFKQLIPDQQTNESTTTVWLAPNVGIVKFKSEHELTDEEVTLELTSYDIKSDESDSESDSEDGR